MHNASPPVPSRAVATTIASLIAMWFVAALVMSCSGRFQTAPDQPPLAFGLTLSIPLVLAIVSYAAVPGVRLVARSLDLNLVTALHLGRIVGSDFILLWLQHRLPALFALPAGLGDITIALTTLPLIWAMRRQTPGVRTRFVIWNVLGIVDLVVALGMGVLNAQGPLGVLAGSGPTTVLMSAYPRALIPTFFVPFYILLHLAALTRRAEVGSPASPAAPRAQVVAAR